MSSTSAVKPDPPQLLSLVLMSKFAQEGQGRGGSMSTYVGDPLLIMADLRHHEIHITFWSLSNAELRNIWQVTSRGNVKNAERSPRRSKTPLR